MNYKICLKCFYKTEEGEDQHLSCFHSILYSYKQFYVVFKSTNRLRKNMKDKEELEVAVRYLFARIVGGSVDIQ